MTAGGGRLRLKVRLLISSPETEAVKLGGTGIPELLVEYQDVGELVALFGPGYVQPTFGII